MNLQDIKKLPGKAWADKRLKHVILGAGANLVSTMLGFFVFFISVPLTVEYLGPERFGVWMAVASLAGMLAFLDFGVGNGLVSRVAAQRVKGNSAELRSSVSNGLLTLTLIGLSIGLLLFLANKVKPLASVINIDSPEAREDATMLLNVFIVLFTINIPLNGIYKVLLGLQRNWMVHATKSTASIVSLILIVLLARNEASPAYLLAATFGVQVAAAAFLLPYLFKQDLISLQSLTDISSFRGEYRSLLNVGGLFFVLQIGMMVGWGADALLISTLSSVSAVAQYAVVARLYQFVLVPVTIINTPLWGAYADAHAHKDFTFITHTLKVSIAISAAIGTFVAITLLLASDLIFEYWLKDDIIIPKTLIVGFTVWKILASVGHALAMALNGMHIIKPQVISVILLCALALPLKLVYTPEFGASAVVWSTVIAYALSTFLFYLVYFRRHISDALSFK